MVKSQNYFTKRMKVTKKASKDKTSRRESGGAILRASEQEAERQLTGVLMMMSDE